MLNISGAINFKCSRYSRDSLNQTFLFPKTFTRGSLTSSDKIFRFSIFHSTQISAQQNQTKAKLSFQIRTGFIFKETYIVSLSKFMSVHLFKTKPFSTLCFAAIPIGMGNTPGKTQMVIFGIKSVSDRQQTSAQPDTNTSN